MAHLFERPRRSRSGTSAPTQRGCTRRAARAAHANPFSIAHDASNRLGGKNIWGRDDEEGFIMSGHLSMGRQTLRWQALERLGGRAASAIWTRTRLTSSTWAAPSMNALQRHEQRRSVFLAECKADAHRRRHASWPSPARLLQWPDAPQSAASKRPSWQPPAAPPPRLLSCQQDALVDLQFELLVKKLLLPAPRMELQQLFRIRVNENPI